MPETTPEREALRRLVSSGVMLVTSVDEARAAFKRLYGVPLPMPGLSGFVISLSQADLLLEGEEVDPDVPGATFKALAVAVLDNLGEDCELDHAGYCQAHFVERPCSVAALAEVARG